MAVADADYKFIWCSVGLKGRESDAGIWRDASLRLDLEDPANPLNVPAPRKIPGKYISHLTRLQLTRQLRPSPSGPI